MTSISRSRHKRLGMPLPVLIAAGFLLAVASIAALAQVLAPFPYEETNLLYRLRPPFWMERAMDAHPLERFRI